MGGDRDCSIFAKCKCLISPPSAACLLSRREPLLHHSLSLSLRLRLSILEGERFDFMENQKHGILMVSDFFYPNFGGVENHIYYLSQCLLKLGHKHPYEQSVAVYFSRCEPGHLCFSHKQGKQCYVLVLSPEKVFVIPNAVDTAMFKPAPKPLDRNEIIIVVISRLVYRKGADLLVEVIPEVCQIYPNKNVHLVNYLVHIRLLDCSNARYFLLPGCELEGVYHPAGVRLEEMREKHSLQDRVKMLGAVPHAQVRSVLISGHIFLNSSLTEAFCIAILESASCGLLTISTCVLPDDMIVLAEPDPDDMVLAIWKAISILPKIDPQVMHNPMKKLYNWQDVAKRTEIVYDRALKCSNQNLLERLSRYLSCGAWAGKLFALVMIIDYLLCCLLQLWKPAKDIDEVPDIILPKNQDKDIDKVPGIILAKNQDGKVLHDFNADQ
ncbi:hypothetical protein QYF36_010258 [Acer negundo]|nr:hypothetical protein QYF36_010258 [Acer negundo]